MKQALRWLPVLAAIGLAFWLGTLDSAKHRATHPNEAVANK
jgi:hypothetical protein